MGRVKLWCGKNALGMQPKNLQAMNAKNQKLSRIYSQTLIVLCKLLRLSYQSLAIVIAKPNSTCIK